jgi:hypothetical protein
VAYGRLEVAWIRHLAHVSARAGRLGGGAKDVPITVRQMGCVLDLSVRDWCRALGVVHEAAKRAVHIVVCGSSNDSESRAAGRTASGHLARSVHHLEVGSASVRRGFHRVVSGVFGIILERNIF